MILHCQTYAAPGNTTTLTIIIPQAGVLRSINWASFCLAQVGGGLMSYRLYLSTVPTQGLVGVAAINKVRQDIIGVVMFSFITDSTGFTTQDTPTAPSAHNQLTNFPVIRGQNLYLNIDATGCSSYAEVTLLIDT